MLRKIIAITLLTPMIAQAQQSPFDALIAKIESQRAYPLDSGSIYVFPTEPTRGSENALQAQAARSRVDAILGKEMIISERLGSKSDSLIDRALQRALLDNEIKYGGR
jgi:hypothetical protein